ncbi:MAG: outer membrane beta-barrel protein [Pseudomonadota bacterium]
MAEHRTHNLFVLIVGMMVSAMLIPSTALATPERTGWYTSVMYLNANEEVDSLEEDRGSTALKIGRVMSDKYSLEAHGSIVNSSDTDDGIFTVSGFARYGVVDDDYSYFGLAGKYAFYGIAGLSIIRSYSTSDSDITESSLSFGAGVDIFGSPNLGITLEYIYMIDAEIDDGRDLEYQTLGIGLTYYFVRENNRFNRNRRGLDNIRE